MLSFREWQQGRAWSADKRRLLRYWRNMPNDKPFAMQPIPADYDGPTYRFDGLRLTGSYGFIDSVLSRLKDMTGYENQNTRLRLVLRQQVDKQTQQPIPGAFVLYAQARDRQKAVANPPPAV